MGYTPTYTRDVVCSDVVTLLQEHQNKKAKSFYLVPTHTKIKESLEKVPMTLALVVLVALEKTEAEVDWAEVAAVADTIEPTGEAVEEVTIGMVATAVVWIMVAVVIGEVMSAEVVEVIGAVAEVAEVITSEMVVTIGITTVEAVIGVVEAADVVTSGVAMETGEDLIIAEEVSTIPEVAMISSVADQAWDPVEVPLISLPAE